MRKLTRTSERRPSAKSELCKARLFQREEALDKELRANKLFKQMKELKKRKNGGIDAVKVEMLKPGGASVFDAVTMWFSLEKREASARVGLLADRALVERRDKT